MYFYFEISTANQQQIQRPFSATQQSAVRRELVDSICLSDFSGHLTTTGFDGDYVMEEVTYNRTTQIWRKVIEKIGDERLYLKFVSNWTEFRQQDEVKYSANLLSNYSNPNFTQQWIFHGDEVTGYLIAMEELREFPQDNSIWEWRRARWDRVVGWIHEIDIIYKLRMYCMNEIVDTAYYPGK